MKNAIEKISKNRYKLRLLQKILSCFVWEGEASKKFDSRMINLNTFIMGASGVIKNGNQYISIIGRDGGKPLPNGFGDKLIGTDYSGNISVKGLCYYPNYTDKEKAVGVLLQNDTLSIGVMDIVERYAALLEIADKSIEIAMLNTRVSPVVPVSNKIAKEQLEIVFSQIYDGKPHAYYDPSVNTDLMNNGLMELLNQVRNASNINDLIEARADIYSRFCIEIGIPVVNNTKRSQLISGEIGGISTLSLVNLKDMLERRKEFCDRFNDLYNEDLSVRIADEFLIESEDQGEGLSEDQGEGSSEDLSEGKNIPFNKEETTTKKEGSVENEV